jgi:hypothetical protein
MNSPGVPESLRRVPASFLMRFRARHLWCYLVVSSFIGLLYAVAAGDSSISDGTLVTADWDRSASARCKAR